MAPFNCPPPGCYPPVTGTWELTNQWTGRSTLVYSSHSQPPQWSQDVWNGVMLHTDVPPYALDEFHRLGRPEHPSIGGRPKSRSRSLGRDRAEHSTRKNLRSRSRSRGRNYDVDRIHKGEYKDHVPSKQDFTVKPIQKKPSQKELKSIMKHKDGRIFFDDVKGPYYGFTTFSNHPVVYDGFKFPTAEHLLLYFKVRGPSLGSRCSRSWSTNEWFPVRGMAADWSLPPRPTNRRQALGGSRTIRGQEIDLLETREALLRSHFRIFHYQGL